jgi:hypothetical protein
MHEVAGFDSFLQYHAGRKQWHGSRAVEFLHAAQRGEQAPRLLPRLLILPLRPTSNPCHAPLMIVVRDKPGTQEGSGNGSTGSGQPPRS